MRGLADGVSDARVFTLTRRACRISEGFRSVVVIAKVGASRDETKTQARKSSQLM